MQKFKNILIASDIDGTVLWESQYIHPRNFEKLRYFCANGGHFSLSTGRSHKDVFAIAGKLRPYINMPCILCNGSYLFDTVTEKILNPHYLNPLPLMEAFKEVKSKYSDVGMRAGVQDGFLCPEEDEVAFGFLKESHLDHLASVRPIDEFADENIYKAVFISNDGQKILSLQSELREHYGDVFNITTSGIKLLEILPAGVSKTTQFPYLKKLYPHTELWCIGDFYNDLEMLLGADVAVCPANAVDEIKKICHLQVCHCKDGALAEMIDAIEKQVDAGLTVSV